MASLATHTFAILLAEDEENLRNIITFNLQQAGYKVYPAKNGQEALDIFLEKKAQLHLALLDVSMPKINGFEVCERIKQSDKNFPVFFLTVRKDRDDRIYGLKLGADDYLSKPFDLEELLLRIKKILARYEIENICYINHRQVNFNTLTVTLPNGQTQTLSIKEAALLKYFLQHKNKALSRQDILKAVWDKTDEGSYRTIDNMVVLYRKLFEEDSRHPKYFLSIRGLGYVYKES